MRLFDYALAKDSADAEAERLRKSSRLQGEALERNINETGYGVREILGPAAALRVFDLNTRLFPASANAWDSLAETYQALGKVEQAKRLYLKAKALAPQGAAN